MEQRELALKEKDKDLRAILASLNVAYRVLGSRFLVIFSALLTLVMFGWAVLEPAYGRIAAACLCSVFVFLPALWADARQSE